MRNSVILSLGAIVVLTMVTGCGPNSRLSIDERQAMIQDMECDTLAKLYKERPAVRRKLESAAGYGVFSSANVNIIFISGGGGYGVVTDNTTRQKTYMKMALGGVGLGIGVKDYRQVLIFRNRATMDKFVDSGWEFGGHADAAAKAGETGGEVGAEGSFDDIDVYAMTESGLALQATVAGTKYWKDDELNWVIQ